MHRHLTRGVCVSSATQKNSEHRGTARANLGIEQWRISPSSAAAYAFATLCVAVASLLHWGIGFISEDSQHFTTYYPAVLIAALVGGAGAGTYAAILGGIIAWWAFMPPHVAFLSLTFGQVVSLLIYFLASLFIVWAANHYRELTKRLEDEEKFRKMTVEELAHRLKNKIATIQSIISLQLRDSPQTRDAIIGRLIALSATDDLIMETQGQGARTPGNPCRRTRSLRSIPNSSRGTGYSSFAEVSDDDGVVGPRTHYKLRKIRCLIECDWSGSYSLVAIRHTFEPRMA